MKVVVLHRVESLREEPSGYYVLVEMEGLPAPLLLKEIVSDYAALLVYLTHAGVEVARGWHVSIDDPVGKLPEQVRAASYSLSQAPKTRAEMGMDVVALMRGGEQRGDVC